MKRTGAVVLALVVLVIAALAVGSGGEQRQAGSGAPPPPVAGAAPAPAADRDAVRSQRELPPRAEAAVSARARRRRLLEVSRLQAWELHGVAVLAGPAIDRGRRQEMWVTPAAAMTTDEIGTAVARICRALHDPCTANEYAFVVKTTSGSVPLPHAAIDLETQDEGDTDDEDDDRAAVRRSTGGPQR